MNTGVKSIVEKNGFTRISPMAENHGKIPDELLYWIKEGIEKKHTHGFKRLERVFSKRNSYTFRNKSAV